MGAGRHPASRRPAEGRVQPRDGPGLGGRRGDARQPSDVNAITFTGSVATGKQAWPRPASSDHAQVPARDGRQEPDRRARRRRPRRSRSNAAVNGAFFSTGQRCTASSRLIVTEGIHDKFVAAHDRAAEGDLVVDDALEGRHADRPGGRPRASSSQDTDYIEIGQKEGAKLAVGGELLKRETPGFYLQPALLHRGDQPDAHHPRGDLRAGGHGDPRQGLRRGAGDRQRHASSACRRASAPRA